MITIRPALPSDVPSIQQLVAGYADNRILLARDLVGYYEAIQEFVVAEQDGIIIGCGALHVMWADLGEVRTVAVSQDGRRNGTGRLILEALVERARTLQLSRLFCLTFEVKFFSHFGFQEITGDIVEPAVYREMLLSHDDGVAEFLDLARVKPNTLGNSRMLLDL